MPIVIDGKKIAAEIIAKLKQKPAPKGFIAVCMRKSDEAADSFVKQKEKTARELGIELRRYEVREDDINDSLRERVRKVSDAKKCIGVILQLPLPAACDPSYIANTIPVFKDLDCLSARAAGALYQEKGELLSPAVRVVRHILETQGKSITDFPSIAIVGQGMLVGKPLGVFLAGKVSRVTLFEKGFDTHELVGYDLVLLGTGSAGLISGKHIKKGGWVIDFGYGMRDGNLLGDFDVSQNSIDHIALYTPTPGGTGPILVASLFENLFEAR